MRGERCEVKGVRYYSNGFVRVYFYDEYAFVLFGLLGFVYRCGAKR